MTFGPAGGPPGADTCAVVYWPPYSSRAPTVRGSCPHRATATSRALVPTFAPRSDLAGGVSPTRPAAVRAPTLDARPFAPLRVTERR
jgi:hypothetical protein